MSAGRGRNGMPAPAAEPGGISGMIVIDSRCTACGNCIITCPPRALLPAANKPRLVPERCTGCGACIEVCPTDAISEARAEPAGALGAAIDPMGAP